MFNRPEFDELIQRHILEMSNDLELRDRAMRLMISACKYDYAYHHTWLGLPIIQLPEDIVRNQELFWADRPEAIIETGVAWGGSIVLHASLMELAGGTGKVVAVDRVLPKHLTNEIMKFPFSSRIHLIEGDSIDPKVIEAVRSEIDGAKRVAVFLDSNHSHSHVLAELREYSKFVTKGQHLTVYATAIEKMPVSNTKKRPWGPGANPMTAIKIFLHETSRFVPDEKWSRKTLVTFAPDGRLLCVE